MTKKNFFLMLVMLFFATTGKAQQESETAYNFLRIPVSAHAAALGSNNITLCEDDASLVFSNPALLSNVSEKTVNLNYMNYMQGVNAMSAAYNMAVLKRGSLAFTAQYMAYGNITETLADGSVIGDFNAKDLAFGAHFAYLLTDKISAGIAARVVTSYIASYNSMGVGIDVGLNYYNEDSDWSVSAVVKNLGGQVKAYNDDYEAMPIDIQLGVSKRLTGTPLRFHATLVDLNHTSYKLKNHLALGADFLFSESIWAGIGYNPRRSSEMSFGNGDDESAHGAGLSLGAGVNLDRFGVNVAWGKYHVASSSIIINLSYKL